MRLLLVGGIILFIAPFFFVKNSYDRYTVKQNGHLVKMRIEKLPASCIGSKVPYFITLSFEGQFYDKQTRGDFCDKHHVGEFVDIQYLEGAKHILFPEEPALFDLVSCGLLSLFGIFVMFTQRIIRQPNIR